jgi:hypothetical protein
MTYHSVEEIFADIEGTRGRLVRSVEGLGEGQENFRTAPDRWSIADIVEHLSVTEQQSLRLFNSLVRRAEDEGRVRADDAPFAPVTIAEQVERTRAEKYTAPEGVRPAGGVPLADSLARLRDSRAALHALRPRIERLDCADSRFPHPIFGLINLYQWLAFIGAHEARHLAQIEALKETMKSSSQ